MILFWVGFFAFVALLLALDLGVLHRKATTPTLRAATLQTIAWLALGLAFAGFVYLMYEHALLGARMLDRAGRPASGLDAAIVYLSAYLLEQALSVDNIFVISLLFANFRVPPEYQHRVLFWGILGAVVFRVIMLSGGAYLANHFSAVFYIFGAYLAFQGLKLLRDSEADEHTGVEGHPVVRLVRRIIPVVDGEHGGRFIVQHNGRRALTTIAVCLIVVELTDIVFALDSIPAVLSVSQETFIMVTSNIFAILGLRSLYFVLAGAMAKFHHLKVALAVLLILIGFKMIAHNHMHIPHTWSLAAIVAILTTGVLASLLSTPKSPT